MASGIRRVRGRNGLRARDAAHGHMAVVAVIFVWTVFIVVVHVHVVLLVVLVVLVVLVGAARLRLLLRLLQLFDFLSQFCSALRSFLCLASERDARVRAACFAPLREQVSTVIALVPRVSSHPDELHVPSLLLLRVQLVAHRRKLQVRLRLLLLALRLALHSPRIWSRKPW